MSRPAIGMHRRGWRPSPVRHGGRVTVSHRYPVPAERCRAEHTIDRSRFICTIERAASSDTAQTFIREMKTEFADATHNCWAFVVGPPGSTSRVGLSDDGEPHGTAGRPMLTVLLHSGVGELAAVVTRYYGGVKLGTGGLARAYTATVQAALTTMTRGERVEYGEFTLVVNYTHISTVQHLMPALEAAVVGETYGADVQYRVRAPLEQMEALRRALNDATSGQAIVIDDPAARP